MVVMLEYFEGTFPHSITPSCTHGIELGLVMTPVGKIGHILEVKYITASHVEGKNGYEHTPAITHGISKRKVIPDVTNAHKEPRLAFMIIVLFIIIVIIIKDLVVRVIGLPPQLSGE